MQIGWFRGWRRPLCGSWVLIVILGCRLVINGWRIVFQFLFFIWLKIGKSILLQVVLMLSLNYVSYLVNDSMNSLIVIDFSRLSFFLLSHRTYYQLNTAMEFSLLLHRCSLFYNHFIRMLIYMSATSFIAR